MMRGKMRVKMDAIFFCFVTLLAQGQASLWPSILQERLENKYCSEERGDWKPDWDMCYKTANEYNGGDYRTANITSPNQILASNRDAFEKRNCFCDKDCSSYGDCCADVAHMKSESRQTDDDIGWTCVRLPGVDDLNEGFIYARSKCSADWSDTDGNTKSFCEFEGFQSSNYLHYVPVLSTQTNITYRNIYCAICNGEKSLKQWLVALICTNAILDETMKSEYLTDDNFSPFTLEWNFVRANVSKSCTIAIKEIQTGLKYSQAYGARICKPTIDWCPVKWSDDDDRQRCKMYSAYLYSKTMPPWAYKNRFCAKCHGQNFEDLLCIPDAPGLKRFGQKSYKILFDFNLESGLSVGSKCQPGEIYDTLRKRCVAVHCGQRFRFVDGKCERDLNIRRRNDSLASSCLSIDLLPGEYIVLPNSSILVNLTQRVYNPGEYELSDPKNISISRLRICKEDHLDHLFKFSGAQEIFSDVCLYISVFCLLLHIGCYLMVPKLRNLPGKNLLSLSISLLLGQMLFLFGVNRTETKDVCMAIGIMMHFFYLSYFLWMSVMAFDICRTFRSESYHQSMGNKTFIRYSCYAWLTSFAIIMIAIIVDNAAQVVDPSFRPGYGIGLCWITQKKALIVFFVLPLAIILILNIIMFALTAWSIKQSEKASRKVIKRSHTIRYILYIKLGLIMGLTWILAFVAALANSATTWYLYIFFNGLQGAFIFFAFSFKRKVFYLLKQTIQRRTMKESTSADRKRDTKTTLTTNVNSDSISHSAEEKSRKLGDVEIKDNEKAIEKRNNLPLSSEV